MTSARSPGEIGKAEGNPFKEGNEFLSRRHKSEGHGFKSQWQQKSFL